MMPVTIQMHGLDLGNSYHQIESKQICMVCVGRMLLASLRIPEIKLCGFVMHKRSNVIDPSDLFCQEAETCQSFQTAVTSLLFKMLCRIELPGFQKVCCMVSVTFGFMVYPGSQNNAIHIGLLLKKQLSYLVT